jgi:hypothetical protein
VGTGVIDALELGMVGAGVTIGGVPAGAKLLPGTLGGLLLGRLGGLLLGRLGGLLLGRLGGLLLGRLGGLLLGRLGGLLLGLVVRGFVLVCAKRIGSAATQIPMMPKNFISLI